MSTDRESSNLLIKMYIPITKHTPNNVYSLEIKSTNKNIYIPLTKHMPNNVYRLYSLEIKSTNKNIYIYH